MQETYNILDWLFQQGPLAVFSGIALWWLVKKYEAVDKKKDDLSEKVVELTVLWTEKSETDNNKDEEIKSLLIEIRDLCKNGK